jgi:uncharacterized protein YceK
MKKILVSIIALGLAGCASVPSSTTSAPAAASTSAPSPLVLALENPNNIGKATQAGVQLAATAFLARNPTYAAELDAAADALLVFAAGSPSTVSQADIASVLAKTSISTTTQTEVASYATSAQSLFESSFNVSFPTLKPNYAIYLDAVANGLFGATGKTSSEVTLPVIPWPPAPAPAAASPASAPVPAQTDAIEVPAS